MDGFRIEWRLSALIELLRLRTFAGRKLPSPPLSRRENESWLAVLPKPGLALYCSRELCNHWHKL